MMEKLSAYVDNGQIRTTLTKRMKLTASGLRAAHELIESKKTIGKIGLGVDEIGEGQLFA